MQNVKRVDRKMYKQNGSPCGSYLLRALGQENPDHDCLQQAQTRKDCQDEHA